MHGCLLRPAYKACCFRLYLQGLLKTEGNKVNQVKIIRVSAREILDSRGMPTVEATVHLSDGTVGVASAPSGASTGSHEAHELRDGDAARYNGKGVLRAVENVHRVISPALTGAPAYDQYELDSVMIALDTTENKSHLGANATLAVSLAAARAAACSLSMPLFRYLGGSRACRLPVPMMNILNGGKHASNNLDVQEFMIVPLGAENFAEAMRMGAEVYAALKRLLSARGLSVAVGDEGGFAPDLKGDTEAIECIMEAIRTAGYTTDEIGIALDVAASEWLTDTGYHMPKANVDMTGDDLIAHWCELTEKYPIVSIEDPLGEDDFEGWKKLTERIGSEVMLVGDDLFVTNTRRLAHGIEEEFANAILVKPNQIGTLSETLAVIDMASENGYHQIISHRSGETEDTCIADIAVACGAAFIKAGAPCRTERVAKYNRLMKIERTLGDSSMYGGVGI